MDEKKLNLPEEAVEAPFEEEQEAVEAEESAAAQQMAALRRELEAAMEEKFQQMLDEALRLSHMTDAERAEYQTDLRENDLRQREERVRRQELRAEALELLARRGLPSALADAVGYESREEMIASVDAVGRAFRGAVQDAVVERLRGTSPAAGASAQTPDTDQLDDETYYRLTRPGR